MQIGYIGVIGLVIGSFLNVCIYRLPRGESLVWPGSHCPSCGKRLKALELIPIFSYLALKGRCSECGFRISPRYPVVEAVTGLAFFWSAATAESPLNLANSILFFSGLIVVFFVDIDHWIIPDQVVIPLGLAGLLIAGIQGWGVLKDHALAAGIGFFGFWAIAIMGTFLLKKEAMGGGDVKLAAMMGAFLGTELLLAGLFIGFLIGGLVSFALIAVKGKKIKDQIPFGPMLAAGGMIAMVKGEAIINWYGAWIAGLWFPR